MKRTILVLFCLFAAAALAGPYSRFGTSWASGAAHTQAIGDDIELLGVDAWGVVLGTVTNGVIMGNATTNLSIYLARGYYPTRSNLVGTVTVGGIITATETGAGWTNSTARGSGAWWPTAGERWFLDATDTLYFIGPTQATVRVHSIAR